jgi:hypothetical protein
MALLHEVLLALVGHTGDVIEAEFYPAKLRQLQRESTENIDMNCGQQPLQAIPHDQLVTAEIRGKKT